jgi:phospholipid/cholesterol/gamma-HCH transport system substrate-binding protein
MGLVAIALVLLVILAVGGESGYWWERYPLKTRFNDIQGLKPGAIVRLNGKEVGVVTSVEFAQEQIEVGLELIEDVKPLVTTSSIASIGSVSLLGEPSVDIERGTGGTPLNDGEYLKASQSRGYIDELSSSASTTLQQMDGLLADVRAGRGTLGKLVTDDALYGELQAFVATAGSVTRSLNEGEGTLGALIKDPAAGNALKASLENLQTMTARINSGQGALGRFLQDEAMGKSFSSTAANVEQITGRLSRGEGTAGRLLTDRELYDRLNSMTQRVDELMTTLNGTQGTAGRLLHDRELYDNMNRAVGELRGLLADIRSDPRRYLRVNVSIF